MAANLLIEQGHDVILHARSPARAADARAAAPGASGVLVGDLASIAQTRRLADQLGEAGPFDAFIHNAAVGYREPRREVTGDLEHVFAVNTLAPYLLTALTTRPARLVFLSSGLHRQGEVRFDDLQYERRRWSGTQAYADSKLYDAVLAAAVAARWPEVYSNAVEPGWVATKMGGPGAPDDLQQARSRKHGSPSVTIRRRTSPVGTSSIAIRARRTRRCMTRTSSRTSGCVRDADRRQPRTMSSRACGAA
jgi:NAD(P)-dependent dehydrogenase (short-subunit alcohol dehydrogenase family)